MTVEAMEVSKTPSADADAKEKIAEVVDPSKTALEDIKEQIRYIERSIATKEISYLLRAIRSIPGRRKTLNCTILRKVAEAYYVNSSEQKVHFLKFLPEAMETDAQQKNRSKVNKPSATLQPEVEIYLHLLLLLYLIDNERNDSAMKCADLLMDRIKSQNRRTLYPLAARCYYFYFRTFELTVGKEKHLLSQKRQLFMNLLRNCTLSQDIDGQAVLVNIILRGYIQHNLYDQASRLISRITYPENAPNGEWARYFYYLGRVKAIRLDYSGANEHLQSALRKAPQHGALGFKEACHRLRTVVQLLLGELPERPLFRKEQFSKTLLPYYEVTQAVRVGNLGRFNDVLQKYTNIFRQDDIYTLILRLRHNVIKAGVRRISKSYSRISLQDIAKKLCLDNPDDVEFIVAKAIRDNVIGASINHKQGYLQTNETVDVYATKEPFTHLNQRIQFCLNVRNQSVKAMRYPPKHFYEDETPEERRQREISELENAKELSEDGYDEF